MTNNQYLQKADKILEKLTLREKAELVSGRDKWNTEPIERLGLKSVMMTDGPHGLRKEQRGEGGALLTQSESATCFPTAAGVASSFDTELAYEIGHALADEAKRTGVSAILGPGLNIKRSPLCGRNFEYFSEDPVVSGEMAAALVKGIQENGVAACVKHYALNSQETMRLVSDSACDIRTIRELYTANFERAVRKSKPEMIMTSYNLVNGTYVGESELFVEKWLRGEWGFDGMVVSDWAAVNDRAAGVNAGLDLEMPGKCTGTTEDILKAIEDGSLREFKLDDCARRVIAFALRHSEPVEKPDENVYKRHNELARTAAARACVLMKNDGALPFDTRRKLAVIGDMAKTPRYQGAGSSCVNPVYQDNILSALDARGIKYTYAAGCTPEGDTNEELVRQAVDAANASDVVLAVIGLPDVYESEGYDRDNMRLPDGMLRLISALELTGKTLVVALQLGSPVELPFKDRVNAIVCAYLGGQASGNGFVDVFTGKVNPSGRLAETWPAKQSDLPNLDTFATKKHFTEYREGVYVGYRYYDALGLEVTYPFGHGLSYSDFRLLALKADKTSFTADDTLKLTVTLENKSDTAGTEKLLVFVNKKGSSEKRLATFAKVPLGAGEKKTVEVAFDARAVASYDVQNNCFVLPEGGYDVRVKGEKSELAVSLEGKGFVGRLADYITPTMNMKTPDELFYKLIGYKPCEPPLKPFTRNSTLGELRANVAGKILYHFVKNVSAGEKSDEVSVTMLEKSLVEMPIRACGAFSEGMLGRNRVEGLLAMANGRFFKGLGLVLKK